MQRLYTYLKNKAVNFLHIHNIRCSNCQHWWTAGIRMHREIHWGDNMGGILLGNPYFLLVTTNICCFCKTLIHQKKEYEPYIPLYDTAKMSPLKPIVILPNQEQKEAVRIL